MSDEVEIMELSKELIRDGSATTWPLAYELATAIMAKAQDYANGYNRDASIGVICHKVTIWPVAPTASAA